MESGGEGLTSFPWRTGIALPWWANFALDTLVFALTLHRTWSMPRAAYGPRQYDLVHILWRDGAVYFG